jgi:hypothetical protein
MSVILTSMCGSGRPSLGNVARPYRDALTALKAGQQGPGRPFGVLEQFARKIVFRQADAT